MRLIGTLLAFLLLLLPAEAQVSPQALDSLNPLQSFNNPVKVPACDASGCATLKYFNKTVQDVLCTNTAASDPGLVAAALATGNNVHVIGTCNFTTATAPLNLATQGQWLFGDGKALTVLNVGTNTGITTGLFQCTTGAPADNTKGLWGTIGPIVSDLKIVYTQVNTATRASLRNFAPAFYMQNCLGFRLARLRIEESMVAVDMRGNTGQAILDDLQMSCLSVCVWLDGSLDFTEIKNSQFFPYGNELFSSALNSNGCNTSSATQLCALYQTANQTGPETTSGTDGPIGIWSGRQDLLYITNDLFLIGQGMMFVSSSAFPNTGTTHAIITGAGFDSFSGISMQAGDISINNSYFGTFGWYNTTNQFAINMSGGRLVCGECFFYKGVPTSVSNTTGINIQGGNATFSNNFFQNGGGPGAMFECETAGVCAIYGATVSGTACPAAGCFLINNSTSGAQATIEGLKPVTPGGGATMIHIGADNDHRIFGNGLNGWVNSCPATQTTMRSGLNGSGGNATCN